VPGNITGIGLVGTNNLIKSGATPVTSYYDVLHAMGLKPHNTKPKDVKGRNPNEQTVIDLIIQGNNDGDVILKKSALSISEYNQVMTILEISAKNRPLGSNK